jgi:hypothetical protein
MMSVNGVSVAAPNAVSKRDARMKPAWRNCAIGLAELNSATQAHSRWASRSASFGRRSVRP